ncbi:PAS domain S-box protein [Neobacillus pocheonensis]|uniref:PAS domain S-box protein n=1 Tax=Neobacillus pocheonensis TaxID=363869 RepID=A0ABT0WID7_9BACI|nr:PAS domain S-box protein [Neobacillus pocheonensis]
MLITTWNEGAEKIFGYPKEEAIGKNIELIIPDHYKEVHNSGVERYLSTGIAKILGKTLELEGMRKDGEIIPIELSINNWAMGGVLFFSSIIRDISDRKQAEDALKESEERYRKLIELSPDGLCVYQNNKIVYANDKSAALIGLNNAVELIGRESLEFLSSEKNDEVQQFIHQLYREQETYVKFEAPLVSVNGENIIVEASASLIQYNGKLAIMTTFRDISERKKVEQQLKEANELLERLSNIDGLTGIPNRRYFDEMFELEWKVAARHSAPLSILLCDVDYFKAYNDTYGHQAGDYCLTEIASSFSKVLKGERFRS